MIPIQALIKYLISNKLHFLKKSLKEREKLLDVIYQDVRKHYNN